MVAPTYYFRLFFPRGLHENEKKSDPDVGGIRASLAPPGSASGLCVYLSHCGEESLRVEEAGHPEAGWTPVEAPAVELVVPLNQLSEPESQRARVPRDLHNMQNNII